MQSIIEENIRVDIFLVCTHINMIGRNFRKFLQNALGPNAHKLGRHCGADKHLRHPAQLADKFLCALIDRLSTVKLRIIEERIDGIRPGALLAPSFLFIDRHRRIKLILFIGQRNGIRGAFHQEVINVQRHGQSVFSVHLFSSLSSGSSRPDPRKTKIAYWYQNR